MTLVMTDRAIGVGLTRVDGPAKVLGTAPYAYEQPVSNPAYVHPVEATIARGRVSAIGTTAAAALPGVLAVLSHLNAPRLAQSDDAETFILQTAEIGFRGQFIGAVIAETPEIARHGASLVTVEYEPEAHDTEFSPARFAARSTALRTPEDTNTFPSDASEADIEAALTAAPVAVDATYTTPMEHHNPMEPHTSVAVWAGGLLTVYESSQGVHFARAVLAGLFGLDIEQVRVVSPYVGGAFGGKASVHASAVLAVMAALVLDGRPVKLALTRQQMFTVAGHRPPTIARVRLGASTDGSLLACAFDVIEQSSRIKEFFEGSHGAARIMYAAPARRTTHRVADLDVPVPTWMRAPGHCPGMFGLEVAMDELAAATAIDPIEIRVRNEPAVDPDSGLPFASRHLLDCLREGARRFDWVRRDPRPRSRREGGWLIGTGVASSTLWDWRDPANSARISFGADQSYTVQIGAADLGTGTWTALTQIAADALNRPVTDIRMEIGDTALPQASWAGGSSGLISWGPAIFAAAATFREQYGDEPEPGDAAQAKAPAEAQHHVSKHSFGAQFAEVRVHADTGEIRVSRMLGVFSCGRIINPRTARSQFVGAMTMGVGMALHEHSVMDHRFGLIVNRDLAGYHVPTNADIENIDATWLEDTDAYSGALGARGVGEIGIVGTAAAIANAAFHATGVRVRDLPLTADRFLS